MTNANATTDALKQDKVLKIKCQKDLLFFWRWFFKKQYGYKANVAPFHHTIADHLHKVARGEITRLIINIPPRYGKTDIAVKAFVAWTIANNPKAKFIHLSYSDELVNDNSSSIKETVESDEYQRLFGVKLKKDTRSKKKWYTEAGGGVYAVASGGAITGFGAGSSNDDGDPLDDADDFLSDGSQFGGAIIIDDPLKPDDANSDTARNKINERYNNTIRSRTNSRKTPIVVIMQRLHEDDMSGFLLGGGSGEEWTHLSIPALDENDEAIWPFKHTTEELKAMEVAAPYMFAGQMMQSPSPLGGGIFKSEWWRFYRLAPELSYQVITADTAQKTKEQNDYSVFQCWGVARDGSGIYLLDMVRGKWEAPELKQQMLAFYRKQQDRMRVRTVYIEDKSSGTGLIQEIKRGSTLPVRAVPRSIDKLTRAMDVVDFIASGRVWLPEGGSGVSDLLREAAQFPNGKHDDTLDPMMDAIDQCLALRNNGTASVSYG